MILKSAEVRKKLETTMKIAPIVGRPQRKSPEGEKYISMKWKLEAFELYDSHLVSDVMKGVTQVHKVWLN